MQSLAIISETSKGYYQQKSLRVAAIRTHLAVTWLVLWLKPKTFVSSRRRSMLKALRQYWMKGSFPTNESHLSYTPTFRDNYGVLCAMGHLAFSDSQSVLVDRIVANNNTVDLSKEYNTEFDAWIQTTGLSYKEAARIQPGYPWQEPYVEHGDKLFAGKERILAVLILIPLYICLIGAYMIIGKHILRPGSASRVIFVASVTIAILAAVSSLLFITFGELS